MPNFTRSSGLSRGCKRNIISSDKEPRASCGVLIARVNPIYNNYLRWRTRGLAGGLHYSLRGSRPRTCELGRSVVTSVGMSSTENTYLQKCKCVSRKTFRSVHKQTDHSTSDPAAAPTPHERQRLEHVSQAHRSRRRVEVVHQNSR